MIGYMQWTCYFKNRSYVAVAVQLCVRAVRKGPVDQLTSLTQSVNSHVNTSPLQFGMSANGTADTGGLLAGFGFSASPRLRGGWKKKMVGFLGDGRKHVRRGPDLAVFKGGGEDMARESVGGC